MRLYSLELRSLGGDSYPPAWSVIEANVRRRPEDARPESWDVDEGSVRVVDHYEYGDVRRTEWLYHPTNLYEGVEHVRMEQRRAKTSLAPIIAYFVGARLERVSPESQRQWGERQPDLPVASFRPFLTFHGASDRDECTKLVMDWKVHALAETIERENPGMTLDELSSVFEDDLRRGWFSDHQDTRVVLGSRQWSPGFFDVVTILRPEQSLDEPWM
jgi:hypothetical protein